MATQKRFDLRTSYAGCDNPKAHIKASEKIVKKFGATVRYIHDKGAAFEIDATKYDQFESAMRQAGIQYLISDSGSD